MRRMLISEVFFLTVIAIVIHPPCATSQGAAGPRTIGKIVRFDDRADELIPSDAEIELLASGFEWSEGPLWVQDADGGHLLFSDIPANARPTAPGVVTVRCCT